MQSIPIAEAEGSHAQSHVTTHHTIIKSTHLAWQKPPAFPVAVRSPSSVVRRPSSVCRLQKTNRQKSSEFIVYQTPTLVARLRVNEGSPSSVFCFFASSYTHNPHASSIRPRAVPLAWVGKHDWSDTRVLTGDIQQRIGDIRQKIGDIRQRIGSRTNIWSYPQSSSPLLSRRLISARPRVIPPFSTFVIAECAARTPRIHRT